MPICSPFVNMSKTMKNHETESAGLEWKRNLKTIIIYKFLLCEEIAGRVLFGLCYPKAWKFMVQVSGSNLCCILKSPGFKKEKSQCTEWHLWWLISAYCDWKQGFSIVNRLPVGSSVCPDLGITGLMGVWRLQTQSPLSFLICNKKFQIQVFCMHANT